MSTPPPPPTGNMKTADAEFNLRLVTAVEKYPEIYNNKLKSYANKQEQDKAWVQIAEELKESVYECKSRWRILRLSLTRYLRNLSYDEGNKNRRPYYLHKAMQFVIPYTKLRGPNRSTPKAATAHYAASAAALNARDALLMAAHLNGLRMIKPKAEPPQEEDDYDENWDKSPGPLHIVDVEPDLPYPDEDIEMQQVQQLQMQMQAAAAAAHNNNCENDDEPDSKYEADMKHESDAKISNMMNSISYQLREGTTISLREGTTISRVAPSSSEEEGQESPVGTSNGNATKIWWEKYMSNNNNNNINTSSSTDEACAELDEAYVSDMHFFKSLLPDLNKLSQSQKRQFKRRVLQLFDELEEERQAYYNIN